MQQRHKKAKDGIEKIESVVHDKIAAAQLEAQSKGENITTTDEEKRKMVAEQIAAFFIAQKENLDLSKVGDFLGDDPGINGNTYNSLVLAEMANSMPMKDVGYLEALRKFVGKFMLPGEAQKVDRIMVAFAEKFMAENPDHTEFKRNADDITDTELEKAISQAKKEAKRNHIKKTAEEIKQIKAERDKSRPTKASIAAKTHKKTEGVSSEELTEAQHAYEVETNKILEEFEAAKLDEFNAKPPTVTKEKVAEQKTKDLPYQIAFAVMTLQTSLHNPNVPEEQRLSFENFKSLSKGFDQKLSDKFLKGIYDSVKDNAFEVTFSPSPPGISFTSDQLESDENFKKIMKNVTSSSVKYGESMDASTVFPGIKSKSEYKVTFAEPKSWIQKIFGGYTGTATVSKDGTELATVNISRGGWFSRLFGKKSTLSIEPIAHKEIADQEKALVAAGNIAAQFSAAPKFKTTFAYEEKEINAGYNSAKMGGSGLISHLDGVDTLADKAPESKSLLISKNRLASAPGILGDIRDKPKRSASAAPAALKGRSPDSKM